MKIPERKNHPNGVFPIIFPAITFTWYYYSPFKSYTIMSKQQAMRPGKYLSCFAAILLLLATTTSCKKSSGGETEESPGKNTFSLDGKTFKDATISYDANDAQLRVTHIAPGSPFNTVNSVTISFSDDKIPTEGGTFRIVNNPYSPGDTSNNDELSIIFTSFPYNYGSYYDDKRYSPRFEPQQTATVSVDANKKVTVRFSNIVLTNNVDATTTTASGSITQP